MGSKALLVLVLLLASVLLLSAQVSPKDVDEKFDKNDGNLEANGVDDMKHYRGGHRGYGGGRRGSGGWSGGCPYGCCRWNYYRGYCRKCCYYPGEQVDAHIDAEPRN